MSLTQIVQQPLVIYSGAAGSEVTLGIMNAEAKVKVASKHEPVTVAEYGESAVDYVHNGDEFTIEGEFADWNQDCLEKALFAANTGDGTGSYTGCKYVGVGRCAGWTYSQRAFTLTARPLCFAKDGVCSFDVVINKAIGGHGDVETTYAASEKASIPWVFVGLVVSTDTDGENIGRFYSAA